MLVQKLERLAFPDPTVEESDISDHAFIRIEQGVKDKRTEGCINATSSGGWYTPDHCIE